MTRAIILAAGRGSRLRAATQALPKCMVKLWGRPLLDYQMAALRQAGINNIAVVGGYLKERIHSPFVTQKFENKSWQTTNMVASLFAADAWLSAAPCLVSYGDIFYCSKTIEALLNCPNGLAIAFDQNYLALWQKRFESPWEDLESFKLDENGYLLDIGQKILGEAPPDGQYMGLLKFTPSCWSMIKSQVCPGEISSLDMTSLLHKLLGAGRKIKAVLNRGPWGEVDNQQDLALYEQFGVAGLDGLRRNVDKFYQEAQRGVL